MTLPQAIEDREYQKFKEVLGSPHVQVTGAGFTGSFSQSGLSVGGVFTEVTIDDTAWYPLPPTPAAGRNAISVQNFTGFAIKLNYDYSGPLPAGYTGVVVNNSGERMYGIKDTILIYAKAEPGAGSIVLGVEELI